MAIETLRLKDGTLKYRGSVSRVIDGKRKIFNTPFVESAAEALKLENQIKKDNPKSTTGRKPGSGLGVGQFTDEEAYEKYGPTMEKKFKQGKIPSTNWSELDTAQRQAITADARFTKALDERVIKFKLGDKEVELPKGTRVTSFRQTVNTLKKGIKALQKWEQDPTPENWNKIFSAGKNNKAFGMHLRSYLANVDKTAGVQLPPQTKKIFDAVNIKQFVNPNNIDTILDFTRRKTLKKLGAQAGSDAANITKREQIIKELQQTNKDPEVRKFIQNQNFRNKEVRKISEYLGRKLNVTPSIAARRIQELASAYMGDSDYLKLNSSNPRFMQGVKRITDIVKASPFTDFGTGFKRDLYEKYISKALGEKPSFMQNVRTAITKQLPSGYQVDEVRNVATGAKLRNPAYSVFQQGVRSGINIKTKKPVDRSVETAERELQKISRLDPNYDEKRKIIKDRYNKIVKEFVAKANKKKGPLPVRALELSFDAPNLSVGRYNELPKNVTSLLDKNFEDFEYSFKVPKDLKTTYEIRDEIKNNPNFLRKTLQRAKLGLPRIFTISAGIYFGDQLLDELSRLNFGTASAAIPEQYEEIPALNSEKPDVEFGDPSTWRLKVPEFIEEYPVLSGTGAAGATALGLASTAKGRKIGASIVRNFPLAFNPLTAAGITYGFRPEEGYDLSEFGSRLPFEIEAAVAKDTVLQSSKLARKIPASNPLLRRGIQRVLNLGLSPAMALRAARIATPLGVLSLAGEGGYALYKAAQDEQARIEAMDDEQRANYLAEQEEISRFAASEGGRIGFADGSDPEDPSRRKFIKKTGGIMGLLTALGSGLIKLAPRAQQELVKLSSESGAPEWFASLIEKVIRQGKDVTKDFAEIDRQVIHKLDLDADESVTVIQDLTTGDIKVKYQSADNMGNDSVDLNYKAPEQLEDGTVVPAQFNAVELEPRGIRMGPDDYDIEFDGENVVDNIDDLLSDTTKLKSLATGETPSTKEMAYSISKKDRVAGINEDITQQAEYLENKYGPGDDLYYQDFSDYD